MTFLKKYLVLLFIGATALPLYAAPPLIISEKNKREIPMSNIGHLEIMQESLQEQMKGFIGKSEETEHRLEEAEATIKMLQEKVEKLSQEQNISSEVKQELEATAETKAPSIQEKKPEADDIMNDALAALEEKSYEKSEALWKSFVKLYPNNPYVSDAHYWLGDLAYMREAYEESSVAFYHAYQTAPQGTKAPHNLLKLSMSLLKLNKTKSACKTLGKMLKEFPVLEYSLRKQVDALLKEAQCPKL